ncbi:MAG TPA: AMP-dependent synthetase/ligase [Nocardioidaceae bacterium]|nr:AMP-dependent synthetase/ligase [Nocardioidaceae bacterium]
MREFGSPATYAVPASGNLTDDVVRNGTDHPGAVAFSVRRADSWRDVTAAEFLAEVREVAGGLAGSGVEPGDRVALLASTRYEWTLLDYAIWFAGGVTVPVYATSTPGQTAEILADCGATALVVETEEQLGRVRSVQHRLEALEQVWCLEHGGVAELAEAGRAYPADDLEQLRTAAGPQSLATVVYTSGTTGPPRGCELTHGNFMFEVGAALEELDDLFDADDAATLLVLPLAHVFARVVQVGAVRARVRLGHCTDVRRLGTDLRQFRPTFVLAVPRVFEQVLKTAGKRAAADGRRPRFDRAAESAIAYSRALDAGRPGALMRVRHAVYERLVYAGLREVWGGRCAYGVSGGAPLGDRLGHLYRGIGLPVLEGYGLTETTAAVTVNRPDALKLGTVGRPIGGTTVRVADDGELTVSGGQVTRGYWGDPSSTAEVLAEDGWLRTGDLGEIDDEGFVRVTGRKTEILVTTGGKNVAPGLLEERIRAHPLVSQCMVVGDGRPFLAALVTVDEEVAAQWATARGKRPAVAALVHDRDLEQEIQTAVDDANKAVSQAESVRRFVVLPVDWTEEDGLLTPSLKVKRNVVMSEFRHVVDDLYAR